MQDLEKTKDQLIDELNKMRSRVAELETAEEATREIGERYRQLVETANDIIFQTNEGGFFTFVNPVALRLTGYTEKEILGKHYTELIRPDYREKATRFYGRQFVKRLPATYYEFPLVTKHGMTLWIGQNTQLLMDGETVVGFQSIARDITERKLAEEALRETEEKYRVLFEGSPVGILVADAEKKRFLYVNPAICRMLGYSSTELLAMTVADIHPENALPLVDSELMAILDGAKEVSPGLTCRRKDGTVFHVDIAGARATVLGRECAVGFFTDVTQRKRAEEALKVEKQRFERLGENSPFGLVIIQPDGSFPYANPKFKEMFGYDLGDVPNGREWFKKAYPDPHYRHEVISSWMEHVKSSAPGETTPMVFRVTCKDGSEKIVHFRPVKLDSDEDMMTCEDITERKRGEEELKKALSLLHSTLESTTDGILVVDSEGKMVVFNQRFVEMWQIPQNVVESRDDDKALAFVLSQLTNPEAFLEKVRELYNQAELDTFDVIEFKDGRVFERYSQPQRIENKVVGRVWSFRDVTEQKRTDETLTLEKQRFQKLAENSPFGMVMIQPGGSFSYANPKFREMFGYDLADVPNGREWFRKAYPDTGYRHTVISGWMEDVNDHARGETRPRVFAVTCKDGTEKTIHFRPVKLASGEDLMTCEDITDRKRIEDELRQSEDRYRTLVEDSFDGIFVQKGPKIIFANSRLYEMLGYPPGELEGMDHWLVYHPDYQEITRRRAIDRMRNEEVTSQYEVMLQKKDGSSFLGEISARRVQLDGDPGIQVWIRDISGRRRSEEAQRRLAIAVEQAAEAIVITDTRGTIQYVNPAFEQIAGYSPDEVIGENPRILQSGQHDQGFYRKLWQTITNGKAWKGQFVNKKKDGTLYREDATISPVRDSSGKIVNYVAVKRDITHEIQLQQQLLQAQKMEAIGTLAGGVAHDFNNLLQIVLGYSEILLKGKQEGDHDYDGLKKISLAGKRGADLVQSLLTLSRKVEPQLLPSNLNHEILQVQKLLSRTIPKTIKIDLHLSGDLELVLADPSQIGQIFMNLGVNARDAMPDGGTLTVETANVELDEDYCATHLEVKPGGYVVLSVSDSGHGMGKETLSHIFEPFFTTKEVGKGTGLGLATVYGIVKQHGGHILCYSEPGHGTTFKIYLPSIQTEEESETQTEEMPIPGGTETILLVEDEEVLRELGTELLNGFGYEVITAGNGREALDIYQTEGKRIALVIMDLIMPEMDGRQCLVEILGVDPKARILIASGYSENGPIPGTSLAGARGFVEKPYNMRKLLQTIRDVLDED